MSGALCHRLRKMADESENSRQSAEWQTAEAQANERAVTLRRFLDQSWLRPSPVRGEGQFLCFGI